MKYQRSLTWTCPLTNWVTSLGNPTPSKNCSPTLSWPAVPRTCVKKEGSKEFWQCYKCHIFLGPLANRIILAKIIKGTENRIFVFVLLFLLLYPVFVFAHVTCPPPVMAGRLCSSPTRCPAWMFLLKFNTFSMITLTRGVNTIMCYEWKVKGKMIITIILRTYIMQKSTKKHLRGGNYK